VYHPYKVDTNQYHGINCVCSLSISGPDSFTSPNITDKAPFILEDFWTLPNFTDKVPLNLEDFWARLTSPNFTDNIL